MRAVPYALAILNCPHPNPLPEGEGTKVSPLSPLPSPVRHLPKGKGTKAARREKLP